MRLNPNPSIALIDATSYRHIYCPALCFDNLSIRAIKSNLAGLLSGLLAVSTAGLACHWSMYYGKAYRAVADYSHGEWLDVSLFSSHFLSYHESHTRPRPAVCYHGRWPKMSRSMPVERASTP